MRLVLAGAPRAIAQRALQLTALTAAATLAVAAPSLAADPLAATSGVTAVVPQGGQVTGQVNQTLEQATQAVPAAEPAVRRAAERVEATAKAVTEPKPVREAAAAVSGSAGAGSRSGALPAADPVREATGTVAEVTRRLPAAPAGSGDRRSPGDALRGAGPIGGLVDGALRSLGETLRGLVPLDSLTAPVAALLGDRGLNEPADPARLDLGRVFAGHDPGGVLHAATGFAAPRTGPTPGAPPPSLRISQSASAQPPAAEAGGRPVLPSPRTAPAPTAGGAAAAPSGGLAFVPFLALLVLAALAAPMLLRRLEAVPALLRPSLFVCGLERPG